jgi:hypothetical protein
MQKERFRIQIVANGMQSGRFQLPKAANSIEIGTAGIPFLNFIIQHSRHDSPDALKTHSKTE